MISNKQKTIDSYNENANDFAKKFDALDARSEDIKYVFSLVSKPHPSVLEIGCGNGRDAEEIIKKTINYIGIDISKNLLDIARTKVPCAKFYLEDIETFSFSHSIDIIFAFASLLHISKDSLRIILVKAYTALNEGGIMYISLKYADVYSEVIKEDEFGIREFLLYSIKDIDEIKGNFIKVKESVRMNNEQMWLEVCMRK